VAFSIQYIRERSWGSLIGRINYVNRLSSGISVSDGIQLKQNLIFHRKTNYSYLGAGYSLDPVFPKLRLAYSFYQNFKKGWEADLGVRYIKAENAEIKTVVLGVGKYIGSYWINFRFIQNTNNEYDPHSP
jgi:YaiO family outer membrane protein